jgi:hypothetical protein
MPDSDPLHEVPGADEPGERAAAASVQDELVESDPNDAESFDGESVEDGLVDGGRFDEERGEPVEFATLYDEEVRASLEGWEPPEHLRNRPLPSRLTSWTRTSALGAAMAGLSVALRDIYENQKARDAIVIEVDADGEPHDLPIRLLLDPDDPSGSLCIVRRDPPPPVV